MSSLPKKIWAGLYWLPRDIAYLWRARWPQYVVYCGGNSFGDDLLLTSVLVELQRRGATRLAVVSRLEEIFRHGPPGVRFFNEEWRLLDAARRAGAHVVHPQYFLEQVPDRYDVPSRRHFITQMCLSAGLTGEVALRPYLYLQPEELRRGRLAPNQVVVQCTSAETLTYSPLKHWSVERYREVVARLAGRFEVVQLGSPREPLLPGARDLRGRTSIRESAAILAQSEFHLGYAGFLMHLARAVECRSVIVYGGRERPDQSGYVANENIFTPLACSPCWKRYDCDYQHRCMTQITVDDVMAAIERVLSRRDRPLEVAHETIPAQAEAFPLPWLSPGFDPAGTLRS